MAVALICLATVSCSMTVACATIIHRLLDLQSFTRATDESEHLETTRAILALTELVIAGRPDTPTPPPTDLPDPSDPTDLSAVTWGDPMDHVRPVRLPGVPDAPDWAMANFPPLGEDVTDEELDGPGGGWSGPTWGEQIADEHGEDELLQRAGMGEWPGIEGLDR